RHDEIFRTAMENAGGGGASGRILQDNGDGYFCRFDSPSDAVRAALSFQGMMKAEPWPQPMSSRIGIHLGEVAEFSNSATGKDRYVGLAVDMAARVMSLARGGQILMTRSAFDEARQFVDAAPTPLDAAAMLATMTATDLS